MNATKIIVLVVMIIMSIVFGRMRYRADTMKVNEYNERLDTIDTLLQGK